MIALQRLLPDRVRADLAALSVWTLFCVLFFATLLAGRERLADGDFTGQFHAFARFQAGEMAAGRFPVWAPGTQGGFPFAADPQSAAFYPLRWLTILLSAPWGFSLYVLQLEAILHVWLAGLFTYLLALDISRHRGAALVAAIAFGLGGYLTSYPLLQLAILETVIWLPLVLLLLRRATASPRPLRPLLAAGLVLALSLTAGHPQTFLHVAYMAVAYFVFLVWRARWSLASTLRGGLLLALVALGAGAVTWLPALTLTRYSTRAGVSYEFVAGGQPLLNYLQLFLPGLRSLWSPEYAGLLTLLLALFAWSGRHEDAGPVPGARAETLFWVAAALLAAWLALGDRGLLFQLAYHGLPGFSLFRQQERLLGIASLAVALLAAQGVARWWQLPRARGRILLRPAAALVALGFLLTLSYAVVSPAITLASGLPPWLRQLAIALLALVLLTRSPRPRVLAAMLLLLLADLYVATYPGLQRQPVVAAAYWQQPDWMRALQAEHGLGGPARLDSRNLFPANVGVVYGLEDVHTIAPLKLQFLAGYESLPAARRWQLLGVTHVFAHTPPDAAAEPIRPLDAGLIPGSTGGGQLYRLLDTLPRARLVYEPLLAGSPGEALALAGDPDFAPERQAVLHTPVPGLEAVTVPDSAPAVTVQRLSASRLRIQARTATTGLLVIAEWAYPGWRASLDGAPAPLYPVNYAQQSLLLPPGEHVVELRFLPYDLLAGVLLALLALALVVLLAWRHAWRVTYRADASWSLPALPLPARPALAGRAGRFVAVHWRLLALLFLLGGAGLRLAGLGVQELRGDEAFSFLYARQPFAEIVPSLLRDADPHPPLHYLLLAIWMRLAGDGELALRLPSALAGTLLLPALFQVGRRLLGRDGALITLLLAALSPALIWLSQDVRSQYMLVLLLATGATWLLLQAVRRPRWYGWLLYALFAALAMYIHYYGLFALLAHGLYLLAGRRRLLQPWLLSGLLALLLFSPWLRAASHGWLSQLLDPGAHDLADYLAMAGQELVTGAAIPIRVARWLALLALLVAAAGFHHLWSRRPATALLLSAWLLAALWGIYLVITRRATFNPFYVAVAAPSWFLLLGAGFVSLRRERLRLLGPRLALSGLLLLLVAAAFSLARYYGNPVTYGRTQGYRPLAAYLATQGRSRDLIVPNFPDPSLAYYLRDSSLPQQMQPAAAGAPAATTEQSLAELAAGHDRLWFVPHVSPQWDGDAVVLRWLDYHLLLEEERRFTALTLQAYRPLRTASGLLLPLDALLGDSLGLQGAWLTAGGRPLAPDQRVWQLAPGDPLNVSLVWSAVEAVDHDWTVFVHLVAGDGNLIAQHDGVPAHGTRPTSSWLPGERLLDEHLLEIPAGATGRARLMVGMYDPETLVRQPFAGGATGLVLGEVEFVLPPPP